MVQALILILLACLPPYLNKVYVNGQIRREYAQRRMQMRREMIRSALNSFTEKPHE